MDKLFLNDYIKKFLTSQLNMENRLAQSLLFLGEEHLGKFHTAKIFAKSLLCEKHILGGCDNCNSCKAFDNNWHSDFKVLDTEKNSIKIEELISLKDFLGYRPQMSLNRVLVINNADRLTNEAESSLLKLLEEPNKDSVIILVSSFPKKLMPTILSRLLPLRFAKEPEENLKKFLKENLEIKEDLDFYLELGDNKIGKVIKLIEDKEYFNEKLENIKILINLLSTNFISASNICKELADKEVDLKQIVKDWLSFLQQILVHNDLGIWEKGLGVNLSFLKTDLNVLRKVLKSTLQLQNYVTNYNLNKKLMLETFYLSVK